MTSSPDPDVVVQIGSRVANGKLERLPISVIHGLPLRHRVYVEVRGVLRGDVDEISIWGEMSSSQEGFAVDVLLGELARS